MVLILLAILIAALLALAVAAVFVPRVVVTLGCACVAGLVILLVLAALAGIDAMTTLVLPLGPAGAAMRLALDPLGASFLLLLFLAGVPAALFAGADPAAPPAELCLSLAAMALAVLAADAFTLVLGLMLLGITARSSRGLTVFAVVCLIAAFALAAPASIAWLDCDFAAMRTAPPEGWRAGATLLLVLFAAASLAWHGRAAIGGYVLIRVLLDLCGPVQPLWWGVPLMVLGAAAALGGTLRSAFATTPQAVLSSGSLQQAGLAAVGLGVALLARAVDLPDVALLGLEAAWLLFACHVLCRTLLMLCANAVESGAGTRRLDRLGGLIHRMPVTAICTVVGLFGVVTLPPGLGFAGFWLLFQSLLAATRIGGVGLQLLIAIVGALTALSAGLAGFAAVRLLGVAFLGRPRTPRTAVAEEVPRQAQAAVIGLAALTGLLGVLPALALLPAAPALGQLANGGMDTDGFALALRPGTEAPGYAPVALAALLILVGCAVFWLLRRNGSTALRQESAWSGGFAPPPAWLPFGDPLTQFGPVSFAEPLRRAADPLLPTPEAAAAIRARFGRWQDRLVRVAKFLADADTDGPRSIAAALLVVVVAFAAWLVAP